MMSLRVTAAAAVLILAAGSASAATDLVSNGTFASNNVQNNPSAGLNVLFRDDPSASITDWTYTVPGGPSNNNGGIITVIATDDLNSSANINDGGGSNYGLWNAGNGGLAVITAPPSGDAQVMAQDSAPENTAYLSQTISGLTPGKSYQVTFAFAGLQLRSADGSQWNGDTNEAIEVNLGGTYDVGAGTASQTYTGGETRYATADPSITSYATPALAEAAGLAVTSHGFVGWQTAALDFTATASSEVLNLEAISSSSGDPPFALIDNVQLFAVPEPASWALMILGVGAVGAIARRRRALVAATT